MPGRDIVPRRAGALTRRRFQADLSSSPHVAPRAAMIAEDICPRARGGLGPGRPRRRLGPGLFARVRVLATESVATPVVEGARTRTRAKDRRGRGQRGLWPEPGSKNGLIAWEINVFSVAR